MTVTYVFGLTNFIQFKKIFPMNYQKNNIDVLLENLFDLGITLYITKMKYLRDRDDLP